MILGVDHIAHSASDQDVAGIKSGLLNAGYNVFFEELSLENLLIKKPFLSEFHPVHDLVLMKKNGHIPIEVLNHHSSPRQSGLWRIVSGNEVAFKTSDRTSSLDFWQRLGFKPDPENNTVAFNSLFSRLTIVFEQNEESVHQHFLDDSGFNCLALFSSSVEDDRSKLCESCNCSEIAELRVNGRNLRIFFANNVSGGELVEIFEIKKD